MERRESEFGDKGYAIAFCSLTSSNSPHRRAISRAKKSFCKPLQINGFLSLSNPVEPSRSRIWMGSFRPPLAPTPPFQ
jgi:hypothetical protein